METKGNSGIDPATRDEKSAAGWFSESEWNQFAEQKRQAKREIAEHEARLECVKEQHEQALKNLPSSHGIEDVEQELKIREQCYELAKEAIKLADMITEKLEEGISLTKKMIYIELDVKWHATWLLDNVIEGNAHADFLVERLNGDICVQKSLGLLNLSDSEKEESLEAVLVNRWEQRKELLHSIMSSLIKNEGLQEDDVYALNEDKMLRFYFDLGSRDMLKLIEEEREITRNKLEIARNEQRRMLEENYNVDDDEYTPITP